MSLDLSMITIIGRLCANILYQLVRCLLNIAPDGANWLDDQGDTPLALAVSASRPDSTGNIEVVKTFLAAGASANGGGKEGKAAPIHHAAGHGDVEMIKLLAQEGADVNMPRYVFPDVPLSVCE